MKTPLTVAGALVLATALSLSTVPAYAQSQVVKDPKQDALEISTWKKAKPQPKNLPDIKSVKYTTGKKTVSVKLSFNKLSKNGWGRIGQGISTDRDDLFFIQVTPKDLKKPALQLWFRGEKSAYPGAKNPPKGVVSVKAKYGKNGWLQISVKSPALKAKKVKFQPPQVVSQDEKYVDEAKKGSKWLKL